VTTLFEVSAADVADTTDDYYTPRWIFDAAGLVFDLDVAAPVDPSRRTCPARRYLTPVEDGLSQPWDGLVWMNPPFSNLRAWVERFASHRCGLAFLMPGRKENYWMGHLMRAAGAIAFISADFTRPDGTIRSIPSMMLLAGCGEAAAGAVARVAAADKYIGGAYHVRPPEGR
jgi:hypothetical protein